jgi:hypothetical protein
LVFKLGIATNASQSNFIGVECWAEHKRSIVQISLVSSWLWCNKCISSNFMGQQTVTVTQQDANNSNFIGFNAGLAAT